MTAVGLVMSGSGLVATVIVSRKAMKETATEILAKPTDALWGGYEQIQIVIQQLKDFGFESADAVMIRLDLEQMDEHFGAIADLVMLGVGRGNANVLRPEWLSIFPALQTVKIWTGGKQYRIRLKALTPR